ncbi:hypothetical protein BJV77DRAFT_338816 [Russula vinacea]|nr:hypothetical protein BJV77DRAFT_338816 [Russula vinacea]
MTKMANDMKDESEVRWEKIENHVLRFLEESKSTGANPRAPVHVPVTTFPQLRHIHPNPHQAIASGLLVMTTLPRSPTGYIIKKIMREIGSRTSPLGAAFVRTEAVGAGHGEAIQGTIPRTKDIISTYHRGVGEWMATSTPVAAPASTQVLAPHSISVPDSYHPQGYAPPPQSPHTSLSHPHPIASSSTYSRPHPHAHLHTARPTSPELATAPSSSQQTRHRQGAHPQVCEHEHAGPRDHPQPPPRLHERRPAPQAADDGYRPGDHPRVYEHGHARPRDIQPPPPPRSHERRSAPAPASQAADDGYRQGGRSQDYDHGHARPRDHPQPSSPPPPRLREWRSAPIPTPASVSTPAPQAQAADDGYREAPYADSYALYSPAPSDEQVRWTSTPTPSESVGGQQRRQSTSQSRGSSPSRSYVGHSRHADEAGGGRR